MNRSGAELVREALERLGITLTFGIPGVHTTELFDTLDLSDKITPILVTHEQAAGFMADALARSGSGVGCLTLVPAAGLTHAASGIAGALLDGIPMLVITGGIRRADGRAYQLHDLDQAPLARAISRGYFLVKAHADIMPTLFEAFALAVQGSGGPVVVEIPFEVLAFRGPVPSLPSPPPAPGPIAPPPEQVKAAAQRLCTAQRPAIYVGWGALRATASLVRVAELLGAPVATTLQGLSVFPGDHPLHAGFGFGRTAVPAAEQAFDRHDCLLAIGVRFSELSTGSYSIDVSPNLIHVDIDSQVFGRNYPAALAVTADAGAFLDALVVEIQHTRTPAQWHARAHERVQLHTRQIAQAKVDYLHSWTKSPPSSRVNPGKFFAALRKNLDSSAFLVTDDGNHTFLAAELFSVHTPGSFISPTDFNCMGYAIPAGIGLKLANPDQDVAIVVGDGAFLMSALELVTAKARGAGLVCYIFSDGELGQISQFQSLAYNRKTCSVLGPMVAQDIATGTGCDYLPLVSDDEIEAVLADALARSRRGRPVVVEVRVDYSRRTRLTQGVSKVALGRMPVRERIRFIGRALMRRL